MIKADATCTRKAIHAKALRRMVAYRIGRTRFVCVAYSTVMTRRTRRAASPMPSTLKSGMIAKRTPKPPAASMMTARGIGSVRVASSSF